MKRLIVIVSLLVLALVASGVQATEPETRGGRLLIAVMTGGQEVAPAVGDPDGVGVAAITLNQGLGRICFAIRVFRIDTVTLAHIHAGPAGVNGPVVVDFDPVRNGLVNCVYGIDKDLIKAIRQNPDQYYVNVHTVNHPRGAVRGQLFR
jgi:hypothetical protein